jgi:TPR repeat protein
MVALLTVIFQLQAQEKKKPLAFRNYEALTIPFVLPSTLDLQLLEVFVLMQKANAGESTAQHELGLRYLFGKGFPADTVKAAFWIHKAADQQLPLAQFNYGILLINGQGVEWNPFEAYKYFCKASGQELPEALYVTGLIYSENFIVPRSWPQTYSYIKRAAELGLEAAKLSKNIIERRGLDTSHTTDIIASGKERPENSKTHTVLNDTGFNLLFIDFHRDTASTIEDTTLIKEAYEWRKNPGYAPSKDATSEAELDSSSQSLFYSSASLGNPEALCLLGRCYEHGLNVRKDLILACMYYLRAFYVDSYRAPTLIWKLMNTEEFGRELQLRSSRKDPDALYVWSGLVSVGFNRLLNDKQAFDLLQSAASMGHVPAMIELGSYYFTGRMVQQDLHKAVEWWNRASLSGSREADIRIAAANLLDQIHTLDSHSALSLLRDAAKEGSLLSDLTIAYCYEKGINLPLNKGEAYRIYHKSMLRGSESAYHALRRMHDEIRPLDKEFQMPD